MESRPELLDDREHAKRFLVYMQDTDEVKVDGGRVVIRRSLARDPELLANYHTKMMTIPASEIEAAWPGVARRFGVSP